MNRKFFKHQNELIVSLSKDNGSVVSLEETQPESIESCTMIRGYEDKDCFLVLRLDLETMTIEDVTDELSAAFIIECRKTMYDEEIVCLPDLPKFVTEDSIEDILDELANEEREDAGSGIPDHDELVSTYRKLGYKGILP